MVAPSDIGNWVGTVLLRLLNISIVPKKSPVVIGNCGALSRCECLGWRVRLKKQTSFVSSGGIEVYFVLIILKWCSNGSSFRYSHCYISRSIWNTPYDQFIFKFIIRETWYEINKYILDGVETEWFKFRREVNQAIYVQLPFTDKYICLDVLKCEWIGRDTFCNENFIQL